MAQNSRTKFLTKYLGIERIFSAPYHPQSNGKLETFHKFLKPTLKKMCAEDQDNWEDYVEQVSGTYRGVPNLMLYIIFSTQSLDIVYITSRYSLHCITVQ